jgi:uncharacterized membrane protein
MNLQDPKVVRLESLLGGLLHYGTWVASAAIGLGLACALAGGHFGRGLVMAGIALFIMLPVSRVILMLIVFGRQRDYRFAAIAALVLAIILTGCALGVHMHKVIA